MPERPVRDRLVRGLGKLSRCIALSGLIVGCSRDEPPTPTPPGGSPNEIVLPGAPVMIGAGDIAVCGTSGDEATAKIVDSVLTADSAATVQSVVFTLGDNAYPSGSGGVDNDFPRCFSPSWGGRRIMNVIRPAPGNHDYDSGSGAPYFAYFGERAGLPGKGYYSYDVGEWHVISLNSELYFGRANPSEAREQEDWLRRDLEDHRNLCALAYFHRPLFSSGDHGGTQDVQPLWRMLYEGGVDVVLNGHEHNYERFLPQTPAGVADSAKGIEQIVAGTGGAALRGVRYPLARNSLVQIHGRFGVLKLSLGAGEYRHAFLDADGRVWDAAGRKCH
ncbi:MAG: metallophosphoesterase [Gemmatimonadota bacterium]|nr:metallophosphoesterase [Gemmatimonadota bacterium]